MKKLLIAFQAVCLLFILTSVNAQTKKSKMDKMGGGSANLEKANMIDKAITSGDFTNINNIIAKDGVDHQGPTGDIVGGDSIVAMLKSFHDIYPDMKMEVIKELGDNEYTFQWIRMTGTAAKEDMGMPAGTKVDMTSVEVLKFKDGKVSEHWGFINPSDMMKMMQGGGGMDMKKDSGMQK